VKAGSLHTLGECPATQGSGEVPRCDTVVGYDVPVKISTKTGDGGETGLISGGRVPKDHPRVEAYGTVDELDALLGLLAAEDLPGDIGERLREIQGALFGLGAALADPRGKLPGGPEAWAVEPLEAWIDGMEAELPALTTFILPGGTRQAALAHLARCVCRRAERRVVALGGEAVPEGILAYLNRLSDALFLLARLLNQRSGAADIPWGAAGGGG